MNQAIQTDLLVLDDVSAPLRDRADQAFVAQDGYGPAGRFAGYLERLDEFLLAWQRVDLGPEVACLDSPAQPVGYLPVGRLGGSRVDSRRLHDDQRIWTYKQFNVGRRR